MGMHRESAISVLVSRTVLPHLWHVNQQAAQHKWSRLEVLEEGAGGVRLPYSTKSNMPASCTMGAVPRDVSRPFSYACHQGQGDLCSDQNNSHFCVRALLRSATVCIRLRTRNKYAPSQRGAAVTVMQAVLNTRLFQPVGVDNLATFQIPVFSSIVSLHAHSLRVCSVADLIETLL